VISITKYVQTFIAEIHRDVKVDITGFSAFMKRDQLASHTQRLDGDCSSSNNTRLVCHWKGEWEPRSMIGVAFAVWNL
jgi:hypothetical protein